MRRLVLSTFLFTGCSGPTAPSVQTPVPPPARPAEPETGELKARPGVPDNRQTEEQQDYRRVMLMEDTHRVFKKVAEGEASRGDKEAAAKTRAELREIEDEHRELIIKYPHWQRPVLRH